jgi:hypothetical protein
MRAAQTVRESAVAKHVKSGQIASGITGEAARRRTRRPLVPDPVRLVGVGVEALMAIGLVVLVVAPGNPLPGGDIGSAARARAG